MKRIAIGAAAAVGLYLAALVVAGFLVEGCVEREIEDRIAESLDAEVDIDDVSVSLLRGDVELSGVEVRRERGGLVEIEIATIDVDMAPLGWMAIDRDPRELAIRGARLRMSAVGALAVRDRDREPVSVDALVIEDARLTLMPTALLPGVGRVTLEISRARTGPCTLGSGVSWLFAVSELDAVARVPGELSVAVGYRGDELSVGAGLFGSDPLRVHFPMPTPDPNQLEMAQLVDLAKALAKAIVSEGAKDWLRSTYDDLLGSGE